MTTCRSRMSEGLTFVDDDARAIIVAGIPYPKTPKVEMMKV